MLKLDGICKDYGNGKGVQNITFQIGEGKICGVLGSNGCGKTTTFRLLLGLLIEDKGAIYYKKERLDRENHRLFGYVPEERSMLRSLSVKEQVFYLGRLKKMQDGEIEKNFEYWLKYLKIEMYRDFKIIELSKGNQQKVQMLCALIHDPKVVIFDEPLNGLDVSNVELFKRILMHLRSEKKTILISSHQYHNIEHFCDQIVYLKDGKMLFKGDIAKLKMKKETRILSVHTKKELFKKEKGIVSSMKEKEYQIIEVENKEVAHRLVQQLIDMKIDDFKMELVSLQDIIKEKSK